MTMKDIKGYENLYAITEDGQVWSYTRNRYKSISIGRDGYKRVTLSKKGKPQTIELHRLMALAFIDNPEEKPQVNHKDENKLNNEINNLEWATAKENANYGTRNKRIGCRRCKRYCGPVYCVELDKVYENQKEAAAELGLNISKLSLVIHGKRNTTGGYHFTKYEEAANNG